MSHGLLSQLNPFRFFNRNLPRPGPVTAFPVGELTRADAAALFREHGETAHLADGREVILARSRVDFRALPERIASHAVVLDDFVRRSPTGPHSRY